ncbi:serine/threonine protein kinase-like protein Kin1 [Calycina marina]|uniref:non-specific serine/threonine protein kinase n=1 Tax=Calycina marina TaxID=1763456 RepID=A0A9P8CFX1_9HELO|nr:serine/threonine protein kinase-like protein Kin1 [Calycina marina]
MSTTTSTTPNAVERSRSTRYTQTHQSIPSRSHSTRTKATAYLSPQQPSSSHQTSSSRHRAVEQVLPQANNETSNVTRTSRRSSSKDRPLTQSSEPQRTPTGHRRHHSRQPTSEMATAAANSGSPAPVVAPMESRHGGRSSKSRTTIPAPTGNWVLGKTIGAGSMGKVKLARRIEGGEQVACKIIPRGSTDDGHHQSQADRERADHSKEVRTAREAAIVTLLDHPYICSMRDVVRTNYHWYMLFEFVNGGQMLDYIISHGRLKEKPARKFSRQIASALDYCHRNSIVHRDLKIENILISKTGDIKIIDFGLSNLFAPSSQLKTFCGSLYFAAPELLQARAYTGPEVDVWSFGIVLYVLVCGKVPFDDQSMPALHAKIKKGLVDYPHWISPECKNIISKMLLTDPKQRATLQEIMSHPWITKGYTTPVENFLPVRDPITLPLEDSIVNLMTGFDFGPPELIKEQLTAVIESQAYQRAVRLAAQEKETLIASPREVEKKRGVFEFYKRKNSTTSRDTLPNASSEVLALGVDPVNAFHPLVSVYYLCKEKQARDHAAANPGATSMPRTPGEALLKLSDIAPPKPAHTNAAAYEMAGERPTGGRSRPRARTHGEDDVTESMKHVKIAESVPNSPAIVEPPPEPSSRKESTAAGILRRFSTRRRKEPSSRPPITADTQSPREPSSVRKSFSVRRTRDRESDAEPSPVVRSGGSQSQHSDLLAPPRSADNNTRTSKGLGRSSSVNSAEFRKREARRGASEQVPPRVTYKEPPPPTAESDHSGSNEKQQPQRDAVDHKHLNPKAASTMRAKSLGHARRESIQARRAKREELREANVPEETDVEMGDASGQSTERVDSAEHVKPVFLKGLFSVSTTSTKPVAAIRSDIIRVMKQLGVDYTEIRGGFSCRHTPSIDLKRVVDVPPSSHGNQTSGHKRRISFVGFMGGNNQDKDREEFGEGQFSPTTPKTPGRARGENSYTNSDSSEDSFGRDPRDTRGSTSRAVGETSTHVQSELGGSMILEFEIFIVKVPLLSLHGIQFKRLAGGTWQYKNMADQILRELKL